VADFLTTEVLNQLPEGVREFLINTSILERISGPLAQAITGQENCQQLLKRLKDDNIFLVSLDDGNIWFRYHHLFADLLYQRLLESQPNSISDLYLKASNWFDENQYPMEAIEYALRGSHFELAATIIENQAETVLIRSEIATFIGWVKRLPDEIIYAKRSLCNYLAWAILISRGGLQSAEKYLNRVAPTSQKESGQHNAVKSILFAFQRNIPDSINLARQALDQLPQDDHFFRHIAAWNLSAALFIQGDYDEGVNMLKEVARVSLANDNLLVAIVAMCRLGSYQMQQGNLESAKELFERAIKTTPDQQTQPLPVASEAMLNLGKVYWERFDLDNAVKFLDEGIELNKRWSGITIIDGYCTLAHINRYQGNEKQAIQYIKEAKNIAVQYAPTDSDEKYVATQEALIRLRQGKFAAVEYWASQRDLENISNQIDFDEIDQIGAAVILRYELIIFARYLMTVDRVDEALRLLENILPSMERLRQLIKVFEIKSLRSLGLFAQGKIESAVSAINDVLCSTEPAGLKRIYIEEGPLMADLIEASISRGFNSPYAKNILASFRGSPKDDNQREKVTGLLESLSEREVEVLRELVSELSVPEIADQLHIATSTLRTHIKNIYAKLYVHSRYEAVTKAREYGLTQVATLR